MELQHRWLEPFRPGEVVLGHESDEDYSSCLRLTERKTAAGPCGCL